MLPPITERYLNLVATDELKGNKREHLAYKDIHLLHPRNGMVVIPSILLNVGYVRTVTKFQIMVH